MPIPYGFTCVRETFMLCDLRAIPLDVITLPEGTCQHLNFLGINQCYFLAPSYVHVSGYSTSSLLITFGEAPHSSSVATYRASTNEHSCQAAVNTSQLSCLLTGLSGDTLYTVQAVACLQNGDCSGPAYGHGRTLSDGNL